MWLVRSPLKSQELIDLFQPEACPADHVFDIPRMKGPRREEALARFEVAATQKKAKLIGGRTPGIFPLSYRKVEWLPRMDSNHE